MVFSKQEIAKTKGEGKYYIIKGKNIRRALKKFRETFYISNIVNELNEKFADEDIEYCDFNVVWGDYKTGFKYTVGEEVYYIFLGGTCFYELPEMIAVGKEIDEDVYLICEQFPSNKRYIKFMVVSRSEGETETKYEHVVFASASKYENIIKDIKVEDVRCFAKAYRAVSVFNELVDNTCKKKRKQNNNKK